MIHTSEELSGYRMETEWEGTEGRQGDSCPSKLLDGMGWKMGSGGRLTRSERQSPGGFQRAR